MKSPILWVPLGSSLTPHLASRLRSGLAPVLVVAACAAGCVPPPGETSAPPPPAPPPFADVDAVLDDPGPRPAPDRRVATVRMELAAMKAERNRIDDAARAAAASLRQRESDVARLRSDIAAAKTRIAHLKSEWEEDPSDETLKTRLYEAVVKLRGGEKVEGLESALVRATAERNAARARSDALRRRLAAADSAIAGAESRGETVVDFVRFEEADAASGAVAGRAVAVAGVAESTDGKAIDIAVEDESAKARRDATLESLLEGL